MNPWKRLRQFLVQLKPQGGTAERAVKSAIWLFSQNIVGRMIQLGMMVVLARLIGPTEMGLVGIALLAVSALQRLTKMGLNEALIQRTEEDVDELLDTVWTMELVRGGVIALILFAAAPGIGAFFSEPRAVDLLRVVALSPLLLGMKNPAIVYFQKDLDFHKQFVYRISAEVGQLAVAVGCAIIWPNAWAFVAGYLTADIIRITASYFIDEYRPELSFEREIAKNLFGYGKWLAGSSILFFLFDQGDDVFVGWLLGPTVLAFYQYAYRFSNAPATELSGVITGVMFPTLSKLQDKPNELRSTFLKSLRITAFAAFPSAFGIAVVTPSFVRAFLGSDWTAMILPTQILAIFGLIRALARTIGPVWKAIGRPDLITKISILKVTLLALLIYPATSRYGIPGTAALIVGINLFIIMPIDLTIVTRLVETSYTTLARQMIYPLVASSAMASGTWYLHLTLTVSPLIEFIVLVISGVALYVIISLLLERHFRWDIGTDLRHIVGEVKQ